MGMGQNRTSRGPQVLVLVSIYQGSISSQSISDHVAVAQMSVPKWHLNGTKD